MECEDKFPWIEFADLLRDARELAGGFLVNGVLGSYEVIELMGVAREFSRKMDEISEMVSTFSGKAVLCDLIERFGIEDKLALVQDEFDKLDALIVEAENAVQAAAEAAAQPTLESIEAAISGVYEQYESDIDIVRTEIKARMRDALSVLELLGASSQEIDNAVENAELSTDIESFTNDIFTSLMDDAFQRVEADFD